MRLPDSKFTMTPFSLGFVFLFVFAGIVCAQGNELLENGLHRLVDLQADSIGDNARNGLIDDDPDDSGWDWDIRSSREHHSTAASPNNTFGITGLGLLRYVMETSGDPTAREVRFDRAVVDTWRGMAFDPSMNLAPDIIFLVRMSMLDPSNDPRYARIGRIRYNDRLASFGDAQSLAQHLIDKRGTAGDDGLVPWELGWLTMAAKSLHVFFPLAGFNDHATTYAQALVDDIKSPTGYFQIDQPGEKFYTLGLAFTASTLELAGLNPDIRDDAYARLIDVQKSSGAFPWTGLSQDNSYQSTAYAIMALYQIHGIPPARRAVTAAAKWLKKKQNANGGWEYIPTRECTSVDAEIVRALIPIFYGRSPLIGPEDGLNDGESDETETSTEPCSHTNATMIR